MPDTTNAVPETSLPVGSTNFASSIDLNERARLIHQANIKWWQNPETGEPIERNTFELLALIISELCECLEGERKDSMDDKLPHRKMAEVELADTKIRLFDFAAGFGFNLLSIVYPFQLCENKGQALFQMICLVTDLQKIDTYGSGYTISKILALIDAYAAKHGYDVERAMLEKLAYNTTREDHTHEARRIAGGKQF